jgi:serine/threonine-protein kinase RsbT
VASETIAIAIERDADVVTARQRGRMLAARLGFTSSEQTLVALAISELARNIVSYAKTGEIVLAELDGERRGVEVIARDTGPGIADVELALRDGYSTSRSLGLGLPGARRVVDEFQIDSAPGRGTTVTLRKWLR